METQAEPISSPKISEQDSEKIIKVISEEGKKIIPGFEITENQKSYYLNLGLYFKNSEECVWDCKKGLYIAGDIGTGKTLSLTIMRGLFKNFGIISCRHLVREYLSSEKPASVLDKYGVKSLIENQAGTIGKEKPLDWFFDDLGLEVGSAKNYGNQINVMEEILMDRAEMFISHGMKTYITTNLDTKMLEEKYGERILDRMKQICNYIPLTGTSKRK
jgi:hypothetical protein